MPALDQTVSEKLAALNQVLPRSPIRAFRLSWDDDVAGYTAWILYGLAEPEGETWPLEDTDDLCELTNESLSDVVAYAVCDFRDDRAATTALVREAALGWQPLPQPADAQPSR